MARLRKLADWLEQESPAAANSLHEEAGGMFYDQPPGHSTVAASLPGHDQLDRESAIGRAHAHPASLPLARCGHDPALGAASFLATEKNVRRIMGIFGNLRRSQDGE